MTVVSYDGADINGFCWNFTCTECGTRGTYLHNVDANTAAMKHVCPTPIPKERQK